MRNLLAALLPVYTTPKINQPVAEERVRVAALKDGSPRWGAFVPIASPEGVLMRGERSFLLRWCYYRGNFSKVEIPFSHPLWKGFNSFK